MKSGIRSKILFSFGVLALVIGCSSTAFSQTPCHTISLPFVEDLDFTPDEGWHIARATHKGDKMVFRICANNTANAVLPRPAITAEQAAEDARREKAEKEEERKRAEEERRRSINQWKLETGAGSRDKW